MGQRREYRQFKSSFSTSNPCVPKVSAGVTRPPFLVDTDLLAPPSSLGRSVQLQVVQWAEHTFTALLEDMRVDHGRCNILVSKQGLNGSNVRAPLE